MIKTIAREGKVIAINSNNIEVIMKDYNDYPINADVLAKSSLDVYQTIGYSIVEQVLIESATKNCNINDLY